MLIIPRRSSGGPPRKPSGLVQQWQDTVPPNFIIPSTKGIAVSKAVSQQSVPKAQKTCTSVQTDASDDEAILGGLSDADEIMGFEREAAITSPPKNGQRATSSVST